MSSAYVCKIPSPVGLLTAASDGKHIKGLWIEGQKYYAESLDINAVNKCDLPIFDMLKQWLDVYFGGKEPDFSIPLSPSGSTFRKIVWKILKEIPYGEVTTYGIVAKRVAQLLQRETMSAQAIGGAVGHNPVSILIPCHRVVGNNGSLTGYASGIDTKTKLLTLEGVAMDQLFAPLKGTAL